MEKEKIFINHIDKYDPMQNINFIEEDQKRFLEALVNAPEPNKALKDLGFKPIFSLIKPSWK